jgi:predicted small lipoprotein YifL
MMKKLLTLVFFSFVLTACGQSGPLYLPKNNPQQQGE